MPSIELTKKERIGNLTRVVTETYEIPEKIICEKDGRLMHYDEYYGAYVCLCSNCTNWIRGVDFVKAELEKCAQNSGEEQE